jgi:ABC-type transport system involved in cytochrome c biogenesis permease component
MTTTAVSREAGLVRSTATVTRRALLRYVRTPQLIVLATLQMALFFLIYRYMFGGAIHVTGMSYVDYLVPGFIATGVLFIGIGTATAMADDVGDGFVDRLRSLPIPRSSVLAARVTADTAILAFSTAVTVAIAYAVGFRLHGSAVDGLAAFGLVVLFGFAFEWAFITMGLFAGNAQAAQGMGMIVVPVRAHLERLRASQLDARLAAGVRRAPAADLHGRRRSLAHARTGRRGAPGTPGLVLRDPGAAVDACDRHPVPARRDREVPQGVRIKRPPSRPVGSGRRSAPRRRPTAGGRRRRPPRCDAGRPAWALRAAP